MNKENIKINVQSAKSKIRSRRKAAIADEERQDKKDAEKLDKHLKKLDTIESDVNTKVSEVFRPTKQQREEFNRVSGYDTPENFMLELMLLKNQLIHELVDYMGLDDIEENFDVNESYKYGSENINTAGKTFGEILINLMNCGGDFAVPAEIIAYIEEDKKREDTTDYGHLSDSAIEKGKDCINRLMSFGFSKFVATALAGSIYVECGFNPNVVNPTELAGKGRSGTEGWENAGEGLCGITYWDQKEKVIKDSGVNLTTDKSIYHLNDTTHIKDLSIDDHYKIYVSYMKVCVPKLYELLTTESDPTTILCASYLYKAGPGHPYNLSGVKRCAERYINTHKQQNGKAYNGFCKQISASIDIAAKM